MPASLASFTQLSCALVDAKDLPPDLAQDYFTRAAAALDGRLDLLIARFEQLIQAGRNPVSVVRDDLLPDAALAQAAQAILLLWYTGGIHNASGDWELVSADHYYRALIWEAIGAHAPTLSNGYFGHWKYPPEQ